MPVTAQITGIDALVAQFKALPDRVDSGVKTVDELNYIKALVWDLGYIHRVIKPGPKTLWSVNVFGDEKVLTITAPTGFIRINRNRYRAVLQDEYTRADFAHHPISQWGELAEAMMRNAAQRCADIISSSAPIDSSELRGSIVAAEPGDPELGAGGFYTSGHGPYGTFQLDIDTFLQG